MGAAFTLLQKSLHLISFHLSPDLKKPCEISKGLACLLFNKSVKLDAIMKLSPPPFICKVSPTIILCVITSTCQTFTIKCSVFNVERSLKHSTLNNGVSGGGMRSVYDWPRLYQVNCWKCAGTGGICTLRSIQRRTDNCTEAATCQHKAEGTGQRGVDNYRHFQLALW